MARALNLAPALFLMLALALAGPSRAASGGAPVSDPTLPTPGSSGAAAQHGDAAVAPVDPESVRLQMIFAQGPRRAAVIGGRTVHAGDLVEIEGGTARVERIAESSVLLKRAGERVVLELLEEPAAVRRHVECPGAPSAPCRKP